jgi:uncharacterized hydantoinase/oxoprolinase family protein
MPKEVVTESSVWGDKKELVPSLDDLDEKASKNQVKDIERCLGDHGKQFDDLWKKGSEIQQSLKEKVDRKQLEAAFVAITAEIEKGGWHKPFKEFVESQTRIFEGALNAQYGRFDAHLEALKKETRAGQELPERLRRVAEKHKEEVTVLLQSFTEGLAQKASEIDTIHKVCVAAREEILRDPQAIQALFAEAKRFRDEAGAFSIKASAQLKRLEGMTGTFWNRLRWLFLGLKAPRE